MKGKFLIFIFIACVITLIICNNTQGEDNFLTNSSVINTEAVNEIIEPEPAAQDEIIPEEEQELEGESVELTLVYSNTRVNLRDNPSLDSNILKTIDINTELIKVADYDDNWLIVELDKEYYYVYSKYISETKVTSRSAESRVEQGNLEYVGTYTLTAYCSCAKCCGKTNGITASGTHATAGRTIAAPSNFAFGTQLVINGVTYTVEDRGGAIKGNRIDIYCGSHAEALQFGRKTADVYIIK